MVARIDEHKTFAELVHEVGLTIRAGIKHQDVPLLRVFERLGIKDPKHWSAMNQVTFAYQNALQSRETAAGVDFALEIPWDLLGVARGPLICHLHEGADGLHGHWEYTACLFEQETIRRWIGEYQRLMQVTAAQPHASIAAILNATVH